ncbi:FUSC family protein [Streptomyces sp. NPDC047108]|uniref:FUSC family protein n=1 Tax=Streptomyces sp. NPDC047108 TaxID=3155025 RepID=UPI0033DC0E35
MSRSRTERPPAPRDRPSAVPPGRARLIALVRSAAVAAPMAVGAGTGHLGPGLACSFGAYLTLAAFSSLTSRPPVADLLAGGVLLSLAAAAGAASAGIAAAVVAGAALAAALQGVSEVAGGPLRMAAAMAVLAFLLAGVDLAQGVSWWAYAAQFAAGTLWQALVITATGRTVTGPGPAASLRRTRGRLRDATPFAATLACTGALATGTAWLIPLSHAVWLASSALRVAKPSREAVHTRAKDRVLGTLGGGVIAALLLTPRVPVLLLALVVAVTLCAMQLVTAARYGWWTLCLTVVALVFGMEHGMGDWELAAERIALTVGGVALALVMLAAGGRLTAAVRRRTG